MKLTNSVIKDLARQCGCEEIWKEMHKYVSLEAKKDKATIRLNFDGHYCKAKIIRKGHGDYTCKCDKEDFKKIFHTSSHDYEKAKKDLLEFGKACIKYVRKNS